MLADGNCRTYMTIVNRIERTAKDSDALVQNDSRKSRCGLMSIIL